jgi:hypothetical protein
MGLMSDAAECCQVLVANVCQVMLIFVQLPAQSLAITSKSGPKVMAFVVIKPYQPHPDP